jgi:hypothetical protein
MRRFRHPPSRGNPYQTAVSTQCLRAFAGVRWSLRCSHGQRRLTTCSPMFAVPATSARHDRMPRPLCGIAQARSFPWPRPAECRRPPAHRRLRHAQEPNNLRSRTCCRGRRRLTFVPSLGSTGQPSLRPNLPPGRAPRAVEVTRKGAQHSGAPHSCAVDGTSTALPSNPRDRTAALRGYCPAMSLTTGGESPCLALRLRFGLHREDCRDLFCEHRCLCWVHLMSSGIEISAARPLAVLDREA